MRKLAARVMMQVLAISLLLLGTDAKARADEQTRMADGFVYLRAIAPTILQDIRYAGENNFTGRPVPGYPGAECILVRPAAEALGRVQNELKAIGIGLKVFDCYRPIRAVRAFADWAGTREDAALKPHYHPRIEKKDLIPTYIAQRSSHSRGAAVDLTLITLDPAQEQTKADSLSCTVQKDAPGPGSELDMGTPFDCFDPLSQTRASGIGDAQRANRERLVKTMKRHGFRNYPGEWWHFGFTPEPYPKRYFDFPILPLDK